MDEMQRMMLVNALRQSQGGQQPGMNPMQQGATMNPMQGLSQVLNGGMLGSVLRQQPPKPPMMGGSNPAGAMASGVTGVPGAY